jgi:thiol-disulfide isomerase/thioredoxin
MNPDRRRWLAGSVLLAGAVGRGVWAQATDAARRPWPAARPTPALDLPTWEGSRFNLAEARGKVVLLNFWASWCEPCRSEMPSIELLAERFAKEGLVALAVNFRETDAALRRYLAEWPITLPILRDADGAAARAWGFRGFPSTAVVGRDGRAVFSVTGEVDWAGREARQWITAVL